MTMFHGTRFYAVYSRDRGVVWPLPKTATIKIYRSNCANSPACVLDRPGQIAEFRGLMAEHGTDYKMRDAIMADFVQFGG